MSKVLMIDDNPVEQLIVRRISERDHLFETFDCSDNAAEVLATLQENEETFSRLPDIILLDLHMPRMSGWEFMKRFNYFYRNLKKKIDVYILSSSVSESDRKASMCYPFVKGFLTKPMSKDRLHELSGINQ